MTLSLVAVSTITTAASSDPDTFTLPLPTGTQVGDLLAVGVSAYQGAEVTDSRLTEIGYPGFHGGAYGIATDLTDIDLATADSASCVAMCAALRPHGSPESHWANGGDYEYIVFGGEAGYGAAVAFVSDSAADPTEVAVADEPEWTDLGEISTSWSATYVSLRGFFYAGGDPVPDLTAVESISPGGVRGAFWLFWPATSPERWLRQRQSPKANPRVGLHRPQLRQRQRFL